MWALVIVLLMASAAAYAQSNDEPDSADPGPIATDRPTSSFSPFVLPRGAFQFEAGYRFTSTERNSSTSDVQVFPDLLARYGVGRTFELRLGFDGWTRTDTATGNTTGFSDIAVSSKINLTDERGARPAMGLLIDVNLPVGDANVTSQHHAPLQFG